MHPNGYDEKKRKNNEEFIIKEYVKLILLSFENEFKEDFKGVVISYADVKPLLFEIILLILKRQINHVQDAFGKHGREVFFKELNNTNNTTIKTLVFEKASFNLKD